MKLEKLLTVDAVSDARFGALDVAGITADSRTVKPGDLFVAVAGAQHDGLRFVEPAVAGGAVAIMAERVPASPLPAGVAFVRVADARRALALAAAKFFPRQPQTIAAVTGTSGKTSVAAFTRQIWAATGEEAASIGTIGLVSFTNISRDHLDYHPTMEAYLAAKLRLFTDLVGPRGAAVIEVDHEHADAVLAAAKQRRLRLLTVGRRGEGIRLTATAIDGFAQVLSIVHARTEYTVRLPLVGAFQVENALVAAGLAIATESEPAAVFRALADLKGAKGRLDRVGDKDGAPIFIDYAHKPDALAKALDALRPYASGRLTVVFGCGGDRDPGKRPMMGATAARKADRVIVTDDNPRSEAPAAIRAAILAASPGAIEIGDRGEAIRAAVAGLARGDVLLIAGKGHETGQIVGKQTLPFSDHDAVAAALEGKVS